MGHHVVIRLRQILMWEWASVIHSDSAKLSFITLQS